MGERDCDILIVGAGVGGCAAALAASSLGYRVLLTEETRWIGGQLTAQGVPPDEHPWIEEFGCTRRYRSFRDGVRQWYRKIGSLSAETLADPCFNPGGGWVSRLCFEPKVGVRVLRDMLQPFINEGTLRILLRHKPVGATCTGDIVESVTLWNLDDDNEIEISAKYILDATELGDLLPMVGAEYVVGAESKAETKEPNAINGAPEPDNVQGLTWCFAMGFDVGTTEVVPTGYAKWQNFKPDFWPGPLLGFEVLHAHTGEPRTLPLFRNDGDPYALFSYRQIVRPNPSPQPPPRKDDSPLRRGGGATESPLEEGLASLSAGTGVSPPQLSGGGGDGFVPRRSLGGPVTIVNWPQNDYFEASVIDVDPFGSRSPFPGAAGPVSEARLRDSINLSRSLLHWLRTEAPRHDGGVGYPECSLATDIFDNAEHPGFALYPYIRESRRILAKFTVLEQHVAAYTNPGLDRSPSFPDSIGVGAYRIDLHPSTNGRNMIDTSTLPFEIPLGALVPVRLKNLIPACKNIGTTHITNGCYRLHPVEWNIGEAAGLLAVFCLKDEREPAQVWLDRERTNAFQELLLTQGIELTWPDVRFHAL